MHIDVDRDICQNHGQCVFVAPAIFRLEDQGLMVYTADPEDSLLEDAEEAADVCPLQAITVTP